MVVKRGPKRTGIDNYSGLLRWTFQGRGWDRKDDDDGNGKEFGSYGGRVQPSSPQGGRRRLGYDKRVRFHITHITRGREDLIRLPTDRERVRRSNPTLWWSSLLERTGGRTIRQEGDIRELFSER